MVSLRFRDWLARPRGRLLGIYAVHFYATSGLTLSHYDAKAHLVVARRISTA